MGKKRAHHSSPIEVTESPSSYPVLPSLNMQNSFSDPWAVLSARKGASTTKKPSALSPGFMPPKTGSKGPTPINVPIDPQLQSTWLNQKLALARSQAQIKPSFSSRPAGDDERESENERDGTPSPGQRYASGTPGSKKKKKKKNNGKKDPKQESRMMKKQYEDAAKNAIAVMAQNERERVLQRKRKREATVEPQPTESKAMALPNDDAASFAIRLDTESRATKSLRDCLPDNRLGRVANKLKRETGAEPTEMAVLMETARECIVDISKQMCLQTQGVLPAELLRIVKEQHDGITGMERMMSGIVDDPLNTMTEQNLDQEKPGQQDEMEVVEHGQNADLDETSSSGSSSEDDDDDE